MRHTIGITDTRIDTTIFFLERYLNDADLIYRSLAMEFGITEDDARAVVAARYAEKA